MKAYDRRTLKHCCCRMIVGCGVIVSFLMIMVSLLNARYSVWGCWGYGAFLLMAMFVSELFAYRYKIYRDNEVVFLMALVFLVSCLSICFLNGLGRVCAGGVDAYKAQMALESGKICSFHPPRYVYWYNWNVLLSGLGLVFGRNIFVAQLFNAMSLSFALFAIYKIVVLISGQTMARLVTIAFAFNPIVILYSTVLTSEYWAAAFMVWSSYLIICSFKKETLDFSLVYIGGVLFAGIMLGLSENFKAISVVLKVAVFAVIVFDVIAFGNWKMVFVRLMLLGCICCVSSFVAITGQKCALNMASGKPEANNTSWSGLVYEMVLGLNIKSTGGYDKTLAWKMIGGGPEVRVKLLKDAIMRDWKHYPALMVKKFINLHGSSCSRGGALCEVREAFRGVTEEQRKRGREIPSFLVELADNSLVVFRVFFFLAVVGYFFVPDEDGRSSRWSVLPLLVVMEFLVLEQVIECHGRYKAVIYPFFFLVLPGVAGWKTPLGKVKRVLGNWLRDRSVSATVLGAK